MSIPNKPLQNPFDFFITHLATILILAPAFFLLLLMGKALVFSIRHSLPLSEVRFDILTLLLAAGSVEIAALLVFWLENSAKRGLAQNFKAAQESLAITQNQLAQTRQKLSETDQALATAVSQQNTSEQELTKTRTELKSLIIEFMIKGNYEPIMNSAYFAEINRGSSLSEFKNLSGAYSGAKVLQFYRPDSTVPNVLKLSTTEEVENESEKYDTFVKKCDVPAPQKEKEPHQWGEFGGLEYKFAHGDFIYDYLPFIDYYKQALEPIDPRQFAQRCENICEAITNIFTNLQRAWKWHEANRHFLNIFDQYYAITEKFDDIEYQFERLNNIRNFNPGLTEEQWTHYWNLLYLLTKKVKWNEWRKDSQHEMLISMKPIHGDLNARNIILGIEQKEPKKHQNTNFIDFSHTGNGLTRSRTHKIIHDLQLQKYRDEKLGVYSLEFGNIADDFFRLEANIKFTLTPLTNEEDWQCAWVLENILLKQELSLMSWDELVRGNVLINTAKDLEFANGSSLAEPDLWQQPELSKFKLMWSSVKSIRQALSQLLSGGLGSPRNMLPYHISLLKAGLTIIYWEDERFKNADLQKLYIAMSSALLCEKLKLS